MYAPSWILSCHFDDYVNSAAELAPEAIFQKGQAIRSSRPSTPPLSAYRTSCSTPDLDVWLRFGERDAYFFRLYLQPLSGSNIIQNGRCEPNDSYDRMESSIHDGRKASVWAIRSPFDLITFEIPCSALGASTSSFPNYRNETVAIRSDLPRSDATLASFGLAASHVFENLSYYTQHYIDHLLEGVLLYVSGNAVLRMPSPFGTSGLAGWQERRAKEFMRRSIGKEVSIKAIADECELSVGHFTRAFRRSTGSSPYQWLLKQRLELAQQLLKDHCSLAEIADRCGFTDQSHLTNVFTRKIGMPPGAFRRLHQAPAENGSTRRMTTKTASSRLADGGSRHPE